MFCLIQLTLLVRSCWFLVTLFQLVFVWLCGTVSVSGVACATCLGSQNTASSGSSLVTGHRSISQPVIHNSGSFLDIFQKQFLSSSISEPKRQNINPHSDRNFLKNKHRRKQKRNVQKGKIHLTSFEPFHSLLFNIQI